MGLAFENLVVNNYRLLLPLLHLDGVVITSAGPYLRRGTKGPRGRKGCQIDLLVQTEYLAYAVEIKRCKNIGLEIIDEMAAKLERFPRREGVTLRKALVFDGTIAPSVEERHYFDALIPASKLFGL